jgi:pimeloyl-ACP methyl ester carboxylesterase
VLPTRVRQILTSTAIILAVVILAGATYQGVATALERRKYPHPGRLVDVGGHQLHIYCRGEGSPVVVFEAPAAAMSAVWGWVQPEVGKVTRACSYDRAGLGWSEAGDRPYDPGRIPEELRVLLVAAGERGPYLLVGHSLGSSFVQRFAGLFPAETAGLILVDPAQRAPSNTGFFTVSPWLARAGVLRATGVLSRDWRGLPVTSEGALTTFLNRPDHLTRAAREMVRWNDAVRLGEEARIAPAIKTTTAIGALNDEASAHQIAAAVVERVKRLRRN